MSSKFLNANTDVNLSANSDSQIPSQKAVKTYVDNKTSVLATKEEVTTITNQIGDQVSVIESKIPAEASDANQLADKQFVQDLTSALNFITWVDTLPATGESKYIYAVPREETDTDGKQIAALYLWDGSAWRGAGAFSLNIDPDTLATKAELAGYLPLSGGTLTGQLKILKNTLLLSSSNDTKYVGISMGNDGFAYFSSKVYLPANSVVGTGKILSASDKSVANGVASLDENAKVPSEQIPVATASTLGGVKPDGTTITATADGTISATQQDLSGYAKTADLGTMASKSASDYSTTVQANSLYAAKGLENTVSTLSITLAEKANTADLAAVATSGSYNDLINKPTIPDTSNLATKTELDNYIPTSQKGTASGVATLGTDGKVPTSQLPEMGGGSGFDFEGTKAEFDAAVAAGTITDDSVSLITDDVSGDNVATKAELQAVDSSKADTSLANLSATGKSTVSTLSMPSDRYVDLTVAASSSQYTAPANGWFVVRVPFTGNQACALFNTTTLVGINLNSNGKWTAYGNIPVKKNDVVQLWYNCTPNLFRFVYAEGDK